MSPSARAKQLAEDGTSVIRMLEMASVLAQGETVSLAELKKAREEKTAVGEKLFRVEIALGNSKDKLKKKTIELEKKTTDSAKEKAKLAKDLKSECEATEDEPEDVNSLDTRAQLVVKIKALKLDFLDMGKVGSSIAMN